MPRSNILTGRYQQRDRAQLRGRLDRRLDDTDVAAEAVERLDALLRDQVRDNDVADLEAMDITQYLRDTATIALSSGERLRRLAIHVETSLSYGSEQPRGWLALERIYQAALDLEPGDPRIHGSRSISAHECVQSSDFDASQRADKAAVSKRIRHAAYSAISEAMRLEPEDAYWVYCMGLISYFDSESTLRDALRMLSGGICIQPSSWGWSLRYAMVRIPRYAIADDPRPQRHGLHRPGAPESSALGPAAHVPGLLQG